MKANLDELYSLARDARDSNNRVEAETYYEAILQKDPTGWEAPFYLSYYKVANTSVNGLSGNCENYSSTLPYVFDLAKKSCQDTDSFVNVAKEIKRRTEYLVNMIIDNANKDYPALATGEEFNARVISGATLYLVLAEAFDIYFPNGEMSADTVALRKMAVQHNADSVIKLGIGPQVVANGDFNRAFGDIIAKIKAVDPTYTTPTLVKGSSSSSGCYIATCVYGSYDCPEVWTLRRYRDHNLAKTWFGRLFVKTYYAISPTLVKWFGKTSWFKHMWRGTLDRFVRTLNKKGYTNEPYNDRIW